MIKVCPHCNRQLEATGSNFHKNKTRKDGFQVLCKQCSKKYTDSSRKNTDPAWMRQYGNKFKLLSIIREHYGCNFGCNVPSECIEFHHINPDEKDSSIDGTKVEDLPIELSKCITVCANCHTRIHHYTLSCPQQTNIDIKWCKRLLSSKIDYTKPKTKQLCFNFEALPDGMQITKIQLAADGTSTTIIEPYRK